MAAPSLPGLDPVIFPRRRWTLGASPRVTRSGRSVRRSRRGNEHRVGPIRFGEETFQILDLRQVVVDDIRMARMPREEILMIVLGRVELPIRLALCHDGSFEDAPLIALPNTGLCNPRLLRIRRKQGRPILPAHIPTLPTQL